MDRLLQHPSFLPACILAGVAGNLLVLICVLPPEHVAALAGGSAMAVALTLARLRREALQERSMLNVEVEGRIRRYRGAARM